MRWRQLTAITVAVAVLGSWGVGSAAPGTTSYDFTGAPASPQPADTSTLATWDVQKHSRDSSTWTSPEPLAAQHGTDCAGPPATHQVSSYSGLVFQCRDHVMTALNAAGYGEIMLTPPNLVELGQTTVIRFDVSTEKMSKRDWIDVTITPYADNLALPLLSDLAASVGDLSLSVDLQGPPRNVIHIGNDTAEDVPLLTVIRNGSVSRLNTVLDTPTMSAGIAAGTNQSATRQPFQITLSPGRVKFERLASDTGQAVVFFDKSVPSLGSGKAVVQFGHHSYNPAKDGAGRPATWHWDNVSITPSTPFYIDRADQRLVGNNGVFTFAPAPAGSVLRFSAIGTVRVNGQLVQAKTRKVKVEHFSSYEVPLPTGTTSAVIQLSNDGWYQGPFAAKDAHVWSIDAAAPAAPSAIATATTAPASATATRTAPAAGTATPTRTATATRTASPASTATPTRTATNQPTSIPPSATTPAGSGLDRVMWEGEGWFLSGANLPWFNWNEDFSGNPGGVAANRSAIQARIASHDPHNVRWWAFPGNAWQLTPANIAATFTDFDAALAMAEELDLYYTFVVYSDATSLPVSQSARSTQLAALEILFERYGDNPRILAWEVVNEPEWAIWSGMVNEEATRTYVEAVITLIKDETDAYATVGSAMLDGLALWPSVDFYQPHWYDSMDSGGWCAWCKSADEVRAEFGLADKPIVIGEFYAGADVGGASRYAHWYDAGYAGAWAWSLFPERTQDGMQVTGMSSFDQGHADDGPAGGGSPAPTATATPGATGTLTGIVRGEGRSNHAGIRVQVSPGNLSATTDSMGRFTIVGIRAGNTYTVTATLNGYLVAQQVGVAGTNGVRTLTTGVLRGGDVNMDGIVSIVDLAATSADFDGPPQAGSTDVNGTGIVDIADLAIVSQNFDLQGPTGW